MLFNAAGVASAATGFKHLFDATFGEAKPIHGDLMMEVPSTGAREEHHLGGGVGDLEELKGERSSRPPLRWNITIENKTWFRDLEIPREAWEDDSLGIYNPQVKALAMAAAAHPDALLLDLLVDGFAASTGAAYDGKAFFSATHPMVGKKGSTQSNLQAGALDSATFQAAWQKIFGFQDDYGRPINPLSMGGRLELWHGPGLAFTAKALLENEVDAAGATNTNRGMATPRMFPRLTGAYAAYWFLVVAGGTYKPFIKQVRRQPEFGQLTPYETVREKNVIKFGVDGRWNAGNGLWQLAVGSTGA